MLVLNPGTGLLITSNRVDLGTGALISTAAAPSGCAPPGSLDGVRADPVRLYRAVGVDDALRRA
jgi:hypothetical protein